MTPEQLADFNRFFYANNGGGLIDIYNEWAETQDLGPKEVAVGLTDSQIQELAKIMVEAYDKHWGGINVGNIAAEIIEFLNAQTFDVKEVAVGLTDEQMTDCSNYLWKNMSIFTPQHCNNLLIHWAKTQTFAQPDEELQDKYEDLYVDYQSLLVDKLQLEKAQFTPDWSTAPEWANWTAMDKNGAWHWYQSEPELGADGIWGAYVMTDKYTEVIFKGIESSLQQRPTPPTPKVEAGQTWKQECFEVKVIGVNNIVVAYQGVRNMDIETTDIRDFLAKFERVQP